MKKLLGIVVLVLLLSENAYAENDLKIQCNQDVNTMDPNNKFKKLFVFEGNKLKKSGSFFSGKPRLFPLNTPVSFRKVNWDLIIEGVTEKGTIQVFQIHLNTWNKNGYYNSIVYSGYWDYPFLPKDTHTVHEWKKHKNYSLEFLNNWTANYTKRKSEYLKSKGVELNMIDVQSSPFKNSWYFAGKCKVVKEFK
jgi:hypothetical protein